MAAFRDQILQNKIYLEKELSSTYGFDMPSIQDAIKACGGAEAATLENCIGYCLDHGCEDRGGTVALKRCPHLDYADAQLTLVDVAALQFGRSCAESGCPGGENWVCLTCGETRCSRYVKGHARDHYISTKKLSEKNMTIYAASAGHEAVGHCIALGLGDLSVWCYECNAYVEHPRLVPLCRKMEELKFGLTEPKCATMITTCNTDGEDGFGLNFTEAAAAAAEGDKPSMVHTGSETSMHGSAGVGKGWSPPVVARVCDEAARPGYRSCTATEYLDTDEVLDAKITCLAAMIRSSSYTGVYAGAGLSTGAGISDYATKASGSLSGLGPGKGDGNVGVAPVSDNPRNPLDAAPTLGHHALSSLYCAGFVQKLFQQNHDGLPQKAGFPQSATNEIHGGWFDPSNPVVSMDGTLREDLLLDLLNTEDKIDLLLVLGTSLSGMNADRLVVTVSQKAKATKALGSVIISLQRTQMDELASLRIFAPLDRVFKMLLDKLEMPPVTLLAAARVHESGITESDHGNRSLYTDLPYNPTTGAYDSTQSTTLDLRPGQQVQIVSQPTWDRARVGNTALIIGEDSNGHFILDIGGQQRRLGRWWLEEASAGTISSIPVLNVIGGGISNISSSINDATEKNSNSNASKPEAEG